MHGGTKIIYDDHPKEVYEITNPNVYAKGLLFGKMLLELGDTATLKCATLDLIAEMEFTTKGFFSGSYNGIKGKIKKISTGEVLYELSGIWSETIFIQKPKVGMMGAAPVQEKFFDVATASIHQKLVQPEASQEEFESRRLWSKLTGAIHSRDMDMATKEKAEVEEKQRVLRQSKEKDNHEHATRFFECINDVWAFKGEK
jgi:hypothetical protein